MIPEAMRLSAAGEARRQAMRQMLVTAVTARRRRRRTVRTAVAALLLASVGGWLWSGRQAAPAPLPVAGAPEVPPAPTLVAVIAADPTVMARLTTAAPASQVQFVDDGELVQLLQRDGVAAGLVRRGGRVEVVPHIGEDWLAQQ